MVSPKDNVPYYYTKRLFFEQGYDIVEPQRTFFEIDYGYNYLLRDFVVQCTGEVNGVVVPQPRIDLVKLATNKQLQNESIPVQLFAAGTNTANGKPLRYKLQPNGVYSPTSTKLNVGNIQNEFYPFRDRVVIDTRIIDDVPSGVEPMIVDIVLRGYLMPEEETYV